MSAVRLLELMDLPAGDSGMGWATGSRSAYDAATRPTSIHSVPAAPGT
ncbi:hypothetical protein [Nonomuraea helvata]|uniref:Uncharacterized protein n=1 Tax=Nonomuraea helvata TaxID=37484 RepID=A0ABV5RXX5_9ACTN